MLPGRGSGHCAANLDYWRCSMLAPRPARQSCKAARQCRRFVLRGGRAAHRLWQPYGADGTAVSGEFPPAVSKTRASPAGFSVDRFITKFLRPIPDQPLCRTNQKSSTSGHGRMESGECAAGLKVRRKLHVAMQFQRSSDQGSLFPEGKPCLGCDVSKSAASTPSILARLSIISMVAPYWQRSKELI